MEPGFGTPSEDATLTMTISMIKPIIEISNIHKSYGAVKVLNGVSMSVKPGSVVCIIGPSGSGKSTLLRCINALVPIDEGTIRVGAFQVEKLRTEKSWCCFDTKFQWCFNSIIYFRIAQFWKTSLWRPSRFWVKTVLR